MKTEKENLITSLECIRKHYFDKKDFISSGQINLCIDVINDYEGGFKSNDSFESNEEIFASQSKFNKWLNELTENEKKHLMIIMDMARIDERERIKKIEKNNHTKGEWVRNGLDIRHKDRSIIIAQVYDHLPANQTKEEAEANAKLIAAAPDLLNALVNVFNDWKNCNIEIPDTNLGEIKNVIKKATE